MNLTKLFEIQKQLDERIVKEYNLQGEDLLPKKILALQVELGELANEWRGFKFWSSRQTPHVEQEECDYCGENVDYTRPSPFMGDIRSSMCKPCWDMTKKEYAASTGEYIPEFEDYPHFKKKKPKKLLEEYVDCLHFILSIGLEKEFVRLGYNESAVEGMKRKDITSQFNYLFDKVGDFSSITNHNNYMYIVPLFIGLGEMLGFTWEQIERAYLEKNKENHARQNRGY
jgi:dimeric dUTPase (all-alpha-NTP-PPase superfamily)